jgi:hypothetical protein
VKVERTLFEKNRRAARRKWKFLSRDALRVLRALTTEYRLSVEFGEVIFLDGSWYVTHSGLLRHAKRNRCAGIHVAPEPAFSNPSEQRWAFVATVYKSRSCRGFVGYGDADPSNVSAVVSGAEMRVAETRAVNRALRKAYGIPICSVEEIGASPTSAESERVPERVSAQRRRSNGKHNGGSPIRDHLCQIIRQYQLDPILVKSYAVDFCGN